MGKKTAFAGSLSVMNHWCHGIIQPFAMSDSLSLNCLILGDEPDKMFNIKIPKTEKVSILKDLIKEKKASRLEHVDASDLDLFQVSLPRGGDVDAILQNTQPLDSLLPLSRGFPSVEENHLHVIVRAPINGELIWSESDGLIDIVHLLYSCRCVCSRPRSPFCLVGWLAQEASAVQDRTSYNGSFNPRNPFRIF